ncbi:cellulase-like family protein [Paenibacillus kribbensis]|uniref:cellulase-like family protein n=1 Tax=Paenibacillus kribbensis TaxID=172713 RepID=UPI002DBD59B0|nr:cellulase-like family protein [Paenibacillus kribbensis]MEC0236309.1 cellulase-like family protein [Paenibacillus kribbensis]
MSDLMENLPRKLTITMWDFSWYTMTLPGEPYHDLAARFQEAVDRGYNTIRICAMPFMLFTAEGKRPGPLKFGNLGAVGQRTRWYNCRGGAELDGHAHLLELFRQAKRHGCYIMLSSWEYQQSPSFLAHPALRDELAAIPPQERFMAIARSMDQLIRFVKDEGYTSQIVYAELHNEVEFGQLTAVGTVQGIAASDTAALVEAMQPYVEEAISFLRERHPDVLITASYTLNEAYPKAYVARNMQVAHFHLYLKGVLNELMDRTGLNDEKAPFPNSFVQSLLREDAPPFEEWTLPAGQEWRMEGNPVGMKLIYLHDWVDPEQWDLFLYDRYSDHKMAMLQKADLRLEEIYEWTRHSGMPIVIGEGYVGYTPLYAGFEEGPVGKFIAEYALRKGMSLGFWGMTLCSNCAPHHPFWNDIAWQRKWNNFILDSASHRQV